LFLPTELSSRGLNNGYNYWIRPVKMTLKKRLKINLPKKKSTKIKSECL
jgi:hypothetical protein